MLRHQLAAICLTLIVREQNVFRQWWTSINGGSLSVYADHEFTYLLSMGIGEIR